MKMEYERPEMTFRDIFEDALNTNKYKGADEYQKDAARTIMTPDNSDKMLTHGLLGLCSEVGEVQGIFQKTFQGHEADPEHLIKELGDVLWMIAEICTACGFSMSYVMKINIDKLWERYPDGFDPDKSLRRKEGDI